MFQGKCRKPLRHLTRQVGGLCVSLKAVFSLLQIAIPTMMLRPNSLRLEVAAVQQQFQLLTDDFVLRRVLNHDGINKLFQLSISVSFTIQTICLGHVPVYLAQGFCTVNRHVSHVLRSSIVYRNRSGAAKPR
jgi:hypothetical protein